MHYLNDYCRSLTLLLAVQVTRYGQLTLHLADLRWIHHPLLKLLHLLPGALIVVSCLQTETRCPLAANGRPGWYYAARAATDVLQAELQLLLVGHEVLRHLHSQVVERQDAVEERQHLSANTRFGISSEKKRGRRSCAL